MIFHLPRIKRRCPSVLEIATPGTNIIVDEIRCMLPRGHENLCCGPKGEKWMCPELFTRMHQERAEQNAGKPTK